MHSAYENISEKVKGRLLGLNCAPQIQISKSNSCCLKPLDLWSFAMKSPGD